MLLKLHAIAHWCDKRKIPVLPRLIYIVNRVLFGMALPASAVLGKDVVLAYQGIGTVIHARAVIGERVYIGPNVTVGGRSELYEVPVIGNDVYIGAGARILGPVKVGDGAVIGANAVVIHNVPGGAVVGGVPARVLKTQTSQSRSSE
jgi:serine O-acetyltransferase